AIASAIETGLPGLGVKYCCMCLFVEGSQRTYARAVAHYEDSSSARSEPVVDAGHLWRSLPGSVPPSAQLGRRRLYLPDQAVVQRRLRAGVDSTRLAHLSTRVCGARPRLRGVRRAQEARASVAARERRRTFERRCLRPRASRRIA